MRLWKFQLINSQTVQQETGTAGTKLVITAGAVKLVLLIVGLTKLLEATESVNQLSKELVVKEKELAVASKEAEIVLADVAVKAASAEKVNIYKTFLLDWCFYCCTLAEVIVSRAGLLETGLHMSMHLVLIEKYGRYKKRV